MNPCVKTGCKAWLESQDAVFNGDLYIVEGVYIYRYVDTPTNIDKYESDIFMLDAQAQASTNKHADCTPHIAYIHARDYSMIVIHEDACRVSAAMVEYIHSQGLDYTI